ncbi:MAG: aminoacyl-tRNA hydrolase [Candidatus Stahlbacteria bacterium]|nr:aminoacyl-tRNA hydrolase [Candidatus Stahlbacteria bacterium]
MMKIIFGIGNPGAQYNKTRHNVGFTVIDRLASTTALKLRKNWLQGIKNENGIEYYLIKPLSFVNECGVVAKQLKQELNFELSDFLVVVDDFSLPLGTVRMRPKGSSGGHKGLESIIYHLETREFPRLRIGIGPKIGIPTDFVLSDFTKQELQVLDEVLDRVILSIHIFIAEGINRAIEVCNVKNNKD